MSKGDPADLRSMELGQGEIKCNRCLPSSRTEFSAEMAIHFKGLAGLDKPIVWVFPKLLVCLECGSAEFIVPDLELQVLRDNAPVEGAAVWLGPTEQGPTKV